MQVRSGSEVWEVAGILSDDDAILINRAGEDLVICFPQTPSIPRVNGAVARGSSRKRTRDGEIHSSTKNLTCPAAIATDCASDDKAS